MLYTLAHEQFCLKPALIHVCYAPKLQTTLFMFLLSVYYGLYIRFYCALLWIYSRFMVYEQNVFLNYIMQIGQCHAISTPASAGVNAVSNSHFDNSQYTTWGISSK